MLLPVGSDATGPVSWTAALASGAPAARLKVAVASMPLPITFEFMPYAIQVVLPLLLEHETLLLAAVALGPLATLTLVTSETGELMVHCTAATCAPPDVLREIFKVVLPPGEAVPELMETVACWASAVLAAAHRTKIARSAG